MPPFSVEEHLDVVVEDDRIIAVGRHPITSYPEARVIDAAGKTIMSGFVCSHHHYYSALSRGMLVTSGPQRDFIQTLDQWWWRLDRALDEEAIYYSSLVSSIEAIASGTTTCIDHHASPSFIEGSLELIANGMRKVGVRGIACYETTDRNGGMDEVRRGVEENISFAKSVDEERRAGKQPLVEAMIGGHAPFTLPDEGLELLKDACERSARGIHLHVAEDTYDVRYSHHRYRRDIVQRLDSFGLLSDTTLLVHGLYLNDDEIDILNERGCYLAHNPRSNMNNHVGYCTHLDKVKNLVLGTDGCGSNMFEELKIAFFKHRDAGGHWLPSDFLGVLSRGNSILQFYFGMNFGRIEPGYKADIVVLDYQSPTPLVADNVGAHVVWGMENSAVDSVMIDGNLVLEHRRFPFDVQEIFAKAAEAAQRVWKKVDQIN